MDYIAEKYPNYYDRYIEIYIKKKNEYWKNLAKEIDEYCKNNNIHYVNYFYHDELVKRKKENLES